MLHQILSQLLPEEYFYIDLSTLRNTTLSNLLYTGDNSGYLIGKPGIYDRGLPFVLGIFYIEQDRFYYEKFSLAKITRIDHVNPTWTDYNAEYNVTSTAISLHDPNIVEWLIESIESVKAYIKCSLEPVDHQPSIVPSDNTDQITKTSGSRTAECSDEDYPPFSIRYVNFSNSTQFGYIAKLQWRILLPFKAQLVSIEVEH